MEYKIKKNGFLTFILSLLPGGGHMYLGLMKQGLELMGMFFILILLSNVLDFAPLGFLGVILVFYSIFDALSKRESYFDDTEAHCDIVNWFIRTKSMPRIDMKVIGIAIAIIGILFVIFNLMPTILNYFGLNNIDGLLHIVKICLTAVVLIGGGLYLAFRQPKTYLEEAPQHDQQ